MSLSEDTVPRALCARPTEVFPSHTELDTKIFSDVGIAGDGPPQSLPALQL